MGIGFQDDSIGAGFFGFFESVFLRGSGNQGYGADRCPDYGGGSCRLPAQEHRQRKNQEGRRRRRAGPGANKDAGHPD